MSWDIMKSLSWDHSLTNLPLGNVIIVGILSKLEDRENWDPCCCNARVFLSLINLWAVRMVRTLHSSSAKDIIQEQFVNSSPSSLYIIYVGFISSEFIILFVATGSQGSKAWGFFSETRKNREINYLSWWIWRVSPSLLGSYQESTQNASLLPQVNTNLFNLIARITESNWLDTTFQVEFVKYWISDMFDLFAQANAELLFGFKLFRKILGSLSNPN